MLTLAYTASANVPVIKSDPKIEAQVEQTLKKLTLEEKIGQMMELVTDLFGANDKNGVFYIDEHKTDSILSRYKIGSILNAPNTCAPTAKQWEKYIAQIIHRMEPSSRRTSMWLPPLIVRWLAVRLRLPLMRLVR